MPDLPRSVARGLGALAGAGFSRWATYRQAALAGAFTNSVFGVIKVSVLLAVADSAGGTVAGYDRLALSTYAWVSQALIAVVVVFGWTEVAERVRTGDIAIDLARPVACSSAFWPPTWGGPASPCWCAPSFPWSSGP